VNKLIRKWGSGTWVHKETKDKPEASQLTLNCNKVKNILQWKPVLDIDTALDFVIDWYKNYKSRDVYKLCTSQINQYMRMRT